MSDDIKSYRDLKAWQKGMDLTVEAYRTTESFPKHELYGLTGQIRRAAVSIPAIIAEGWGRGTTADYIRFLRNSRGSLCELETELLVALRLNYSDAQTVQLVLNNAAECSRILCALIQSLERTLPVK